MLFINIKRKPADKPSERLSSWISLSAGRSELMVRVQSHSRTVLTDQLVLLLWFCCCEAEPREQSSEQSDHVNYTSCDGGDDRELDAVSVQLREPEPCPTGTDP